MDIFLAFFLGAIQGITEFLPISSSGHLILFQKLFNITEGGMMFNIIVHVATLFAVLLVFHKQVWDIIKNPFKPYSLLLILATFLTGIMFLLFKGLFEATFSGNFLGIAFLATAVLLIASAMFQKQNNNPIKTKNAVIMGLAQGIAIIPGLSRSGTTICAGLLSGADKEKAAEFSFLMSIPIIVLSLFYELYDGGFSVDSIGLLPIFVGFISAFVFGLLSIKLLLALIKKQNLAWFSLYLIPLGIVCLFLF
ncbi:MAG: undecaprenyl-diphosphate phosphatase [Firmicutes bacterium]|nr:undecaprenyl-diphosphate phosphatase [Bacillota bacterium]